MASSHVKTQHGIHDMIRYQNENHHHYLQFYREMCDLWYYEYGGESAAWFWVEVEVVFVVIS